MATQDLCVCDGMVWKGENGVECGLCCSVAWDDWFVGACVGGSVVLVLCIVCRLLSVVCCLWSVVWYCVCHSPPNTHRNDHTTMTAPLPVCSAKLSIVGPS